MAQVLAMILAGGRVGELDVLTFFRPKSVLPYGGLYRIIDFPMSNLMHSDIENVGILSQYRPFELIRHIANGEPWDMTGRQRRAVILPPFQGRDSFDWYKGTADAVYQNIDFIRLNHPEIVIILSGDHIYRMDYAAMLQFHCDQGAELTIACMPVPLDSANTLRARFGISPLPDRPQVLTDAIQRAAGLLDQAQEALSETVDHPRADPYLARQWVNAALAVLAPHHGDSEPDSQPIRYTLRDGSEESDRTQEVLIFLSEHVEIVIPLPGQTPGVMDPDHELAVTRVELLDGAVRAMLWDHDTVQGAGDAMVVTIVPACASATGLPEG